MKAILFLIFFFAFCSCASAQPQDAVNKFRLAQSFEQSGEYDHASRLYEELAYVDSTNDAYFDGLRRCYEQLKNYDAAIALCLRRLNRQPRDMNLMAAVGALFYKSGNEARADSVWNATIDVEPKNTTGYTIVSTVQSDNRLFDKSIATYLQGRKEIGEPTLFAGELSMLYSLMMNYVQATREFLTMLSLNEHVIDLVESRLAGFTTQEEGLKAATKTVEEAVAGESKGVVFRRLLLWLYMEGKRFDRAFDIAKEIDGASNSNGSEMMTFAGLVFKEKAFDVAAKAYRYAIEKYPAMPQLPNAKFGYALAVEELGVAGDTLSNVQYTLSTTSFGVAAGIPRCHGIVSFSVKRISSLRDRRAGIVRAGLMEYRHYFDLDAAAEILDSLLMLPLAQRMYPAILETTGEITVAQGKLDKASHRYSSVLLSPFALPEEKTHARYCLGEIQYFQGNFDSASSILQQIALALSDDESNDALLLLHFIKENQAGFGSALKEYASAALLERQKKFSEAIPLLTSIVQAFANAPLVDDALIKKAELSVVVGQKNEALAAYQKLLSDYPKSILRDKAQFGIGEVYQFQLKEKDKAIHAYEELLASYPNSLLIEQARKRIRELRGDVL